MKNFTLTCLSFVLALSLNAQTQIDLPITWDDTANVDYTTTAFEGGISAADVDPTNASNNVLKFTKPVGAQPWAGVTLSTPTGLASLIPFDASNNIISVMVYSPAAGLPMRLKAEVAGTPTESVETDATTTVANAWETLTFDFSNESPGTAAINYAFNYNMLSFFGDFLTAASGQVFYVDDVVFGGIVPPPSGLDTIDLPITWDDTANVDYTTTAFEGGISAADVDPTNASNNVLKFTKPVGAQPWAGVTLGNQTLNNPIPFTATENIISVKVYSPAAGLPIMMKAEETGGGFAEATMNTTVANAWETLFFDFSSPSAGSIDYNLDYDVLSFFGDFMTPASGQEFYIDSVFFGLPVPPTPNPTIDTNSVTFQVDMRGYTGSYTTPEVNGVFNGWCGNCNPMTDVDNDSIWEVNIDITLDTIEYKFSHDTWTGQEELDSASACVKTTIDGNNVFVNRFLAISGDTILPAVCWNSCEECEVDTTTGIFNVSNLNLNIYPNPSNTIINIETGSFESYAITMMDALGKIVYSSSNVNNTLETIDVSTFENGIYMVILRSDDNIHTSKVMVSK
jgi:hypothetical protein